MRNNTQNHAIKTLLYPQESFIIRGACYEIYKQFRNTQKESIYQKSISEELKQKGLFVEREKQLPVFYKDKFEKF